MAVVLGLCPDRRACHQLGGRGRAVAAVLPVLIIALNLGGDDVRLLLQAVASAAPLVWFVWRESGKDLQASYSARLY